MATRRLTVIQEPAGEDAEAAARPAWHWVLIGSGLLVTIWTPLVAIALLVARKIAGDRAPGSAVLALLVAFSFVVAGLAAGYLVARFGLRTRPRHAVFAGLAAALEIWFLALLGGAFSSRVLGLSALASLSLIAGIFSALGGWLAKRTRRRSAVVKSTPQ